jgi:hypothetical protein
MEKINIKNAKLTFIWFHPFFVQWVNPENTNFGFKFLQNFDEFNIAVQQKAIAQIPQKITVPWQRTEDNYFWQTYFEARNYKQAPVNFYRKYLIPLREKPEIDVVVSQQPIKFFPEYFYFPMGIAFVLTLKFFLDDLPLDLLVDKTIEIRKDPILDVKWQDGTSGRFKMNNLGNCAIKKQLNMMFSQLPDLRQVEPFSQFTVIQGKGQLEKAINEDVEIQRRLFALTRSSTTWRIDSVPSFISTGRTNESWPPSHALYYSKRGQVIWQPSRFNEQKRDFSSLTCYSRNQLYCALMVEAMGSYLHEYAALMNEDPKLISSLLEGERCARLAATLMGRIYGGSDSTYTSRLSKQHIDSQPGWVESINQVRTEKFCWQVLK